MRLKFCKERYAAKILNAYCQQGTFLQDNDQRCVQVFPKQTSGFFRIKFALAGVAKHSQQIKKGKIW